MQLFITSMPKTLLLMRHGEAEPEGRMGDFERKLTQYGREQVKWATKRLSDDGFHPQLIFHSTAARTTETAQILGTGRAPSILKPVPDLYNASLKVAEKTMLELPNACHTVAIVGHNPFASQLALRYSATEVSYLNTSGFVLLQFETDKWEHLVPQMGRIIMQG
jgi:phosphohistidine phosphatase